MFFCLAVVSWPSSLGYQARRLVPNSFGVLFFFNAGEHGYYVSTQLYCCVSFVGTPSYFSWSYRRSSSTSCVLQQTKQCKYELLMAQAVQGGSTDNKKCFPWKRRAVYCSENRLLVQNLIAIFSNDVSRAQNTMSIYKLRGNYLLLEEKDRKLLRNPGLLPSALCLAVPLVGSG